MAAISSQSGDGGVNSPQSRQHSLGLSPPWTQVVLGGTAEVVPSPALSFPATPAPAYPPSSNLHAQIVSLSPTRSPSKVEPEMADTSNDSITEGPLDDSGNGGTGSNASKKPVWNKPSNGVVEVVSPVMDAVSWPALGESTKSSLKSSSSESLKALSDGSSPPSLQVTGISSPSHKQASANNASHNSKHKRGGLSSSENLSANGGVSEAPQITQDQIVETPHNTSRKLSTIAVESSPRDQMHKESQRGGFGSQAHNGNDHHHQRNSYRRGNGGQHPRGHGNYHPSYGSNRDQDRGNHEWNQHSRNFNNRDTHMHPQRGYPRGYMRPSLHTPTPFVPPPMAMPMPMPVRSFGHNMMYPDGASPMVYLPGPPPPESLRSMPLVAPMPPPVYFAVPDMQLHTKIVTQINYYFSNDNLVKDMYLRQNMDENGWVSVNLIAGFKKVSQLTGNVQLILDAMRTSTVVEVQGDKIRRRNDWMRWIIPSAAQYPNASSPQAAERSPNQDTLASQFQDFALDETTSRNQVPIKTYFSRSSSGEFSTPSRQAGVERISGAQVLENNH